MKPEVCYPMQLNYTVHYLPSQCDAPRLLFPISIVLDTLFDVAQYRLYNSGSKFNITLIDPMGVAPNAIFCACPWKMLTAVWKDGWNL